jgi:hypothetical protein
MVQNRLDFDAFEKSYALRSLRKNGVRVARNLCIIKQISNC